MNRRFQVLGAVTTTMALAVAACGSDKSATTTTAGSSATTIAPATTAGPATTGAPATTASSATTVAPCVSDCKDIVLGFVDSLSGPLAAYGEWQLHFLQAAVAVANESGGVNGHKIRVETADSAASGSDAASAARRLIESVSPAALLGSLSATPCQAVSAITAPKKIPTICFSVPQDLMYPKPAEHVFGASVFFPRLAAPGVQFAAEKLGFKTGTKYAMLSTDQAVAKVFLDSVGKAADAKGFVLTDREEIPPGGADANASIQKLIDSKPEVVFTNPIYPWIEPLVKGLRAAGNQAPVIVFLNANYNGLTSQADPNVYDVTLSDIITDLKTTETGAADAIRGLATVGVTSVAQINTLIGTQGYPSDVALIEALRACGYPCSNEQLIDEMEKVSISLPGIVEGTFQWGTSHQGYQNCVINGWDATKKAIYRVASYPLPEI